MKILGLSFRRFIMDLPRPSKAANIRRLQGLGKKTGSFIIREAIASDIPALAALHAKTWHIVAEDASTNLQIKGMAMA